MDIEVKPEELTIKTIDSRIKEEEQIISANKGLASDRAQNIVALSQAYIADLRR